MTTCRRWEILALSPFIAACLLHGQSTVVWTHQPSNSTYPRATGWNQIVYEPVTGLIYHHAGFPSEVMTVGVTNGSSIVTWLSSDSGRQFAVPSWGAIAGDAIMLNGRKYSILQGSVGPTQLSITANYTACSPGPSCSVSMATGASTIYASDHYLYNPDVNTWIYLFGNRSLSNGYTVDQPNMPSDREQHASIAVDTKRNWLWFSGVGGSGTTPPNGFHTHHMTLTSNPATDVWSYQTTLHKPGGAAPAGTAMAYIPPADVIFFWGGSASSPGYIFCYTQDNPTPGTPTPAQAAAGCTLADDWNQLQKFVPGTNAPSAVEYMYMGYSPGTQKVILFGGMSSTGVAKNDTWTYDYVTKAWSKKALNTNTPPIPQNGKCGPGSCPPWPPMAQISDTGKFIYHYQGAAPADWLYDPIADTWTTMPSYGVGPSTADFSFWYSMSYFPTSQRLVAYAEGSHDMWLGALTIP